jgi:hypothetical protein
MALWAGHSRQRCRERKGGTKLDQRGSDLCGKCAGSLWINRGCAWRRPVEILLHAQAGSRLKSEGDIPMGEATQNLSPSRPEEVGIGEDTDPREVPGAGGRTGLEDQSISSRTLSFRGSTLPTTNCRTVLVSPSLV